LSCATARTRDSSGSPRRSSSSSSRRSRSCGSHSGRSCRPALPRRRRSRPGPEVERSHDMRRPVVTLLLLAALAPPCLPGQAPFPADAPDIPISPHDRVYAAEQFSNTLSVIDPAANKLLGVIRLGDSQPANLSPLYRGQLLVHGLGFSPDLR